MIDPDDEVVRRLMAGDPDTLAEYADVLTEQALAQLRPVLHCPAWCDKEHDDVLGYGLEHRRRIATVPAIRDASGALERPAVEVYDHCLFEGPDDDEAPDARRDVPTAWFAGEQSFPLDVDLVRALAAAVCCDLVPRPPAA